MCKSRRNSKDLKLPLTFLREHNLSCTAQTTCRNAADKVITTIHTNFRDRVEFADQITKNCGYSKLIDYLSNKVATNTMLRERLLNGIADYLLIEDGFETWCDFLSETVQEVEDKGKQK